MKIKTSGLKKKKLNPRSYHWWLVVDKPKKKGRLAQRNKHNQRLKKLVGPSEFRLAVEKWDAELKGGR